MLPLERWVDHWSQTEVVSLLAPSGVAGAMSQTLDDAEDGVAGVCIEVGFGCSQTVEGGVAEGIASPSSEEPDRGAS